MEVFLISLNDSHCHFLPWQRSEFRGPRKNYGHYEKGTFVLLLKRARVQTPSTLLPVARPN